MASAMTNVLFAIVTILSANGQWWVNDYDQVARMECPDNQVMYNIRSIHDNFFEDRRWAFTCRPFVTSTSCFWTPSTNMWDQPLDYNCPGSSFINGIHSFHNNHFEDRRFSFKCCTASLMATNFCYLTDFVNDWDAEMNFEAPGDYVIKGAQSYHDNFREDRRWKFYLCRLS